MPIIHEILKQDQQAPKKQRHSIEADLVEFKDGKVRLRTPDGKILTVTDFGEGH